MQQADEVGAAHPRIVEAVETMLKKGKWSVPGAYRCPAYMRLLSHVALPTGYKEKFGDLSLM